MEKNVLTFDSALPPDELRSRLRKWEPWSIRIDFTNGVSTSELVRRTPFSEHPLSKFSLVETAIPFSSIANGRMLDVGCNSGYNSLHVAQKYGFETVGIDFNRRHIEVSRFFAELAGTNSTFLLDSAESFTDPAGFDVVLHFGTLYHLPNPVLSLQKTFQNLRPGGFLGLETQVYDHPDDPNICFFMNMHNNDKTNYWALSTHVLTKLLELIGFREIRVIKKVVPALPLGEHMARLVLVAQKPAT
jgi:2-polyprenyl-3-methyl-5-hydroxy-6-metoxy-1,4-benzoquinol methylase